MKKFTADISYTREDFRLSQREGDALLPEGIANKVRPEVRSSAELNLGIALNMFRSMIAERLVGGGEIDPVRAMSGYHSTRSQIIKVIKAETGYPLITDGILDRRNLQVTLRSAAYDPDTYTSLESYDNSRKILARSLGRIGVFDTSGNIVLTMTDTLPEGHISGPGEATLDTNLFSLRLAR